MDQGDIYFRFFGAFPACDFYRESLGESENYPQKGYRKVGSRVHPGGRHFEAKNGFLASIEIFEIKGRYDTRPVLAVVLLTPEQKATWDPFLNQEISFSGTLVALDAFGKRVYLTLRY